MPRRNPGDPVTQAFGAAVRRARQERELTLEHVAGQIPRTNREGQATRMDPKYLAAIEGGWHSPTIATAKQIADALHVPLEDLVRDL